MIGIIKLIPGEDGAGVKPKNSCEAKRDKYRPNGINGPIEYYEQKGAEHYKWGQAPGRFLMRGELRAV